MGFRSPWEGAILREKGISDDTAVSCSKTSKRLEMSFGLWARVDSMNHVLDRGPYIPMRRSNLGGHALDDTLPLALQND